MESACKQLFWCRCNPANKVGRARRRRETAEPSPPHLAKRRGTLPSLGKPLTSCRTAPIKPKLGLSGPPTGALFKFPRQPFGWTNNATERQLLARQQQLPCRYQ